MDQEQDNALGEERGGSVDFRHLSAFQTVYRERNYANAGQEVLATRKSVVRMMKNLERHFDCMLFSEGLRGELVASAFAERLYNDLRFLDAARDRMTEHVRTIHENGRVLHVGGSPGVFRTREFRNLFRELQATKGIRATYIPVDNADASKLLLSGHCDLYIGCKPGTANRFVNHPAGNVAFRRYRRGHGEGGEAPQDINYVVSLDGKAPFSVSPRAGKPAWQPLDDSRWLYWLDHPGECPKGSVICGPDIEMDPDYWEEVHDFESAPLSQPLHASFLRQHPYELLPTLLEKIQSRVAAT